MAARALRLTVTRMSHLARTAELMRVAPDVYGAALAAARDESAAAGVTERVLGRAAAESVVAPRDALVERAILTAVRGAPAPCFEAMPQPGRDAVALARLAGYSADRVAASLELRVDEVKSSMLHALRSAALRATS
jgi:DNA-directed RNA polymerase specialized sigma24 family protein